jgi:thioredoxin 1
MKTMPRLIVLLVLAGAVGIVLTARARRNQSPSGPAEVPQTVAMPRLVDLGAGKCTPCKAMAPILQELQKEEAGVFEVVFIDVWENPPAAEPFHIGLIPTQIFFDAEGKELWRHEGFLSKADILNKWRELGVVK